MYFTGIIIVMIRVFDPYFRFLLKQKVFEYFGVVIEEPKQGINAEVLSTFLSSSLNIELVYIILAGITKFSNNNSKELNDSIRDYKIKQ